MVASETAGTRHPSALVLLLALAGGLSDEQFGRGHRPSNSPTAATADWAAMHLDVLLALAGGLSDEQFGRGHRPSNSPTAATADWAASRRMPGGRRNVG
ncbi:hypothetical protein [Mycobacterium tuberculosis]|uniref:hypothetical protein n=1 Tax=Mycobacterium tuberculosis TaxID=1773 RepID=UPI00272CC812|nr:hypothetical protein [Mycobacterium tuberculosis]